MCVLSLIFFVKFLLGLIIPGMCLTSKYFDWWYILTIFPQSFRCLIPFEVTESAHWTRPLLLLYILVREYASEITILLAQCFGNLSSVAHLLVAMISSSQELNSVWFWQIDFHGIGPPERQMIKRERDSNLNSSRGDPSSTALPNWPPQLAS